MKKRLCLALGIVLMALLPGGKALGQNKTVQITVKTLDHRALESAYIYAAAPGTSYFIDTAHLSTSYTGTALPIDSVDVRDSLAVGEDPATGDPIIYRSNIDSATYAYSFIVARDVNGVKVVTAVMPLEPAAAKDLAFKIRAAVEGSLLCVLGTNYNDKPQLTIMMSDDMVSDHGLNAGQMVREAAKLIQGGGGGQPHFAQAGGKNADGLSAAVDKVIELAKL